MADVRTNIVVDDELIEEAMRVFGVNTRREIVDLALRHLVGRADFRRRALALEGTGWDADLSELRPGFVSSLDSVSRDDR
ncbi:MULTISPECIES: type II toxin-antitoxin system VapB family antitoxin [unclassified Frankia]|uniref:type II toxin-antitoxin system VapB family antitoxin n=1 Tax=unclassified Frankia TaxID=2632575 RepID=UPI002025ABE7